MDKLQEILQDFAKHYTDDIPEIPKLDHIPSPTEFLSDYMLLNKPFVIRCRENRLPALENWKKKFYLEDKLYNWKIKVCVTPFHKTYEIVDGLYVEPETRVMRGYDLLYALKRKTKYEEFYFVKQQNNLDDFAPIAEDLSEDVPFATEALASRPIGANLSIFNDDHSTLMHKDQYDNFFYVLRGSRQFKLYPPIAHFCMPYKTFKKYQWVKNKETDEWEKMDLNEEIKVIPNRAVPKNPEKIAFFKNIKMYLISIYPGDAIYIPSLWFHSYHQTDDCFTLNYWYDLKWDLRFPFLRFLSKLCKLKKPSMYKDASVDIQTELEEQYFKDLWEETWEKSS